MQLESANTGFDTSYRIRLWILIALAIVAAAGVMMHAPIAQPSGYHSFADQRNVWGVPNFWNVISNLAFLIVGVIGSADVANRRALPLRTLYRAFFAGACLVAIGSAYYHFVPSDQSLVWDRLPMAIMFMAFFTIIVAEHISERAGPLLFGPLLALGIGSVVYWLLTEQAGHGDLRPYIIAQFLPMFLIPVILLFFPSGSPHARWIWAVLGVYAIAKLFELADEQVYALTQVVSGHTLKHLAGALSAYLLLLAFRRSYPPAAEA